jgi:hypothetical protein
MTEAKKTWIVALTLTLALMAAPGVPWAAEDSAPAPLEPALAVAPMGSCEALALQIPADAPDLSLGLPVTPVPAAPPCRIRCPTTWCQSDSQCTAAPGGVCTPVCISRGCCSYPG